MNFTANTMEVLSLEVSGSSLELVVVARIPYTTSLLPQEALENILLGASSSIYQATGKNITEITLYSPPLSTLSHPMATPSSPTLDNSGGGSSGILSFLPDTITSLSLPVLVGAAIVGTTLLLIIIIFLISSVVVL